MRSTDLGPTLETARLVLRPPVPEDFEPWCAFSGDAEASRFLGGVQTPPVVWRSVRYTAGSWALDGFGMFSVIERATGRWIGRVGPIFPEGWPGREVGWGLARESWGRGYATEAAAACMDFVFDRLGWDDVIHTIAPDNLASAAVARRLGSANRGPGRLPDPFAAETVEIWGQSRDAWRARKG
jgi:RimJ/RimL family protein N-acetyltransferase